MNKDYRKCSYCKSYSELCDKHEVCLRDINQKPTENENSPIEKLKRLNIKEIEGGRNY